MKKREVTANDREIRLSILQYRDRLNRVVDLAYHCLEKEREGNGNRVDNGKLLVSVNEEELYRIPFRGRCTDERISTLTHHINDIVQQGEPGESLWGHIENRVLSCCGSCYVR